MIANSTMSVEDTSYISIKMRHFNGTHGLLELLTRKNVNRGVVTTDGLKRYKSILQLTNAHLQGYETGVPLKHPANPSSKRLYQSCFLRQSGIADLRFHFDNTGRDTNMAGNYTSIPNSPAASPASNGCMLPAAFCRLHAVARGKTAGT